MLKRDDVIKKIAGLIGPHHKVNLTAPDKVILVEVFQVCGLPSFKILCRGHSILTQTLSPIDVLWYECGGG